MPTTRRDVHPTDCGGSRGRSGRHAPARPRARRRHPKDAADLKWSKAPCRFCGTGCGVTVAVKDNRVVATHGDAEAEVNRGLNCVKGYFLSKIMYGDGSPDDAAAAHEERPVRQGRRVRARCPGTRPST